jgi:predicted transposase YdaD
MRTFLDDAFDEGKAIGLAEGEAKGKAEGLAEGEAKGKAEGLAEGEAKGKAEGNTTGKITARYEDGMPIEKIAERTNVSVDLVISVLKKAELIKD